VEAGRSVIRPSSSCAGDQEGAMGERGGEEK